MNAVQIIKNLKEYSCEYEENLKMQGITLDMFYQFTNSTAEDLEKQMHPEAEKRVKYRFMLEEIATLEKVEVTDEEANKEAEDLAKKYSFYHFLLTNKSVSKKTCISKF